MPTLPGQDDVEIRGPLGVRRWIGVGKCRAWSSHKHAYPHETRVTIGNAAVCLLPDGERKTLRATLLADGTWEPSEYFHVPADTLHEVKPETAACEWECAFKHRDKEGNVVEVYQVGLVDETRCYR